MAGSLHGSARTTPRIRAELQAAKEKTSILAARYGLSRTTVSKWRARTTTHDAPMGPSAPHSTVLTLVEEAMVVEFRRERCSHSTMCSAACVIVSRSSPAQVCIAAWNGTAFLVCLRARTRRQSEASSPKQPSATFTSTSARCGLPKASSTCSWRSIASRSSPMSNSAMTPEK